MKNLRLSLLCLCMSGALTYGVETDPVGFVSLTVPAASDASLGAPLNRPNEFQGVIQSISGNTITVAGTPNWLSSQFVYASGTQSKTYYLQIDSGAKEGLRLPIAANDASSVTVTIPTGEDLNGISTNQTPIAPFTAGEVVTIAPYWTLSTVISGAFSGAQFLAMPENTPGTNLANITYTFNGTNWLRGSTISNDVCLVDYQGLILRNNNASQAMTVSVTGGVPMAGFRLRLRTLAASTRQDYRFFYNSPVPDTIGNVISPSSVSPGDQLLFSDNNAVGKNKTSTTLTWNGTNWLQGSTAVTTTFNLQPGWSYVFRKNQTANPSSVVLSKVQGYLQ